MRYVHLPAGRGLDLWWWWRRLRPAAVFVHGLMGYSFSWRHNLEFFAQYRDVYAVDLLGIGHSDRPRPGAEDFGLEAAAGRLNRFLRSLGERQIDLVATSHGAAVAMLAASQDFGSGTQLIRRLALAAPAHPFLPSEGLRMAMYSTSLGRTMVGANLGYGDMVQKQAMAQMYADESQITPETRAGYAVNFLDERSYDYALAVAASWREDMAKLEAVLSTIAHLPVLLLWGAQDQTIPAGTGARLMACFRDAQYVVLPGVGHMSYEEAPADFNRCLLQFLES